MRWTIVCSCIGVSGTDQSVLYLRFYFLLFRQKLCNDEDENTKTGGQSFSNFQNSTSTTSSWSSQQRSQQQHQTQSTFGFQQNNQSCQNIAQSQNRTSFHNFNPQNQKQARLPAIREESDNCFTKK